MFKPMVPKFQARHFVKTGESFCLGCFLSLILWPVFKLIKVLGFLFKFKSYVETFQYWFYKAHITQYAMEHFPKGHWDKPETVKDFADELDAFLRKSEMKSLFTKNLQKYRRLRCLCTYPTARWFSCARWCARNARVLPGVSGRHARLDLRTPHSACG